MTPASFVPRPCLQDIIPYQPGKPIDDVKREFNLKQVIKLASNENPLGPSPLAMAAVRTALANAALYPDGSCHLLRRALARKLRVAPQSLLLGNGSNELLVQLGLAFLEPGDEIVTSHMSFVVYTSVPQLMGAKAVLVPAVRYGFDLPGLLRAMTSKTRIVFIANPNNPTGTVVDPEELQTFLAQVPVSCLVALDEAYDEYVDRKYHGDSIGWTKKYPNLVVLRTFSKAYGLAGLRIGYGVAAPEVVQAIECVREPFNVNSLAQAAAVAALSDRQHVARTVGLAKAERSWLACRLSELDFETVPSQANFVFAKAPAGNAQQWFQSLLRQGVIIRPITGPYVRITAGTRPQNERLIRALKKIKV